MYVRQMRDSSPDGCVGQSWQMYIVKSRFYFGMFREVIGQK